MSLTGRLREHRGGQTIAPKTPPAEFLHGLGRKLPSAASPEADHPNVSTGAAGPEATFRLSNATPRERGGERPFFRALPRSELL